MLTTSARLFSLLSELLLPGTHPGPELARRLAISSRTLRSDVATLRELGYPIEAVPGSGGGYRLGRGNRLPPLLLDDDEALAVALGLTLSATHGVTDISDAAMRALSKLITMVPARLRPRLASLASATGAASTGAAAISSETIHAIATVIQSQEHLRYAYHAADGTETHREIEAYRIVLRAGRWYVVGWDPQREAWRTFRADRMRIKTPNGRRFAARAEPAEGFEDLVARSIETAA
jgi:predicted DNA-binding transcriptional regulator YafY